MLKIGQVVDNETLYRSFKVANSGGMRRNINDNHMVLIWNASNTSVANRWQGDTLHYVGQGNGDQTLTRNNLSLSKSQQSGMRLFLFEVTAPKKYTFRGEFVLASEAYRARQPGSDGRERTVWIFPLRLDDAPAVLPMQRVTSVMAQYLPDDAFALVKICDPSVLPAVRALLEQLRELGVEVFDRDVLEENIFREKFVRWQDRVDENIRKGARAIVRRRRQRADARNLTWGFKDEEVAIDAGDDRVRVQEVLDVIGCGDEFKSIVDQATSNEPMPESPPALNEAPVQDIGDAVRAYRLNRNR